MNKLLRYLLLASAITLLLICGHQAAYSSSNQDALFQVSTYDALSRGVYKGIINYGNLKEHGNLGLGTVEGLDGEMIAADGKFYQVKTDGIVHQIDNAMTTPFALVKFFKADKSVKLNVNTPMDMNQFKEYISKNLLSSQDNFSALRVEGEFEYLKLRSLPKQVEGVLLQEAINHQAVFEREKIQGTMVGIWSPEYVGKMNVPGYHFHFISGDRQIGGHVLDLKIKQAQVSIDQATHLEILLPGS